MRLRLPLALGLAFAAAYPAALGWMQQPAQRAAPGWRPSSSLTMKDSSRTERIHTCADMADRLAGGGKLLDLDVRGDSYAYLASRADDDTHPVLEVMRQRLQEGSKPGARTDGFKVGLAVEGGGMRGCVSAGMISAMIELGLMGTVDAVFGSSAGSLVGAYALSGQPSRVGCSVYYDALTGKGRHFIDTRYVMRAMGLGLLGLPLTRGAGVRDLLNNTIGESVLNVSCGQFWLVPFLYCNTDQHAPFFSVQLDYLLKDVVQRKVPLDWEGFWASQENQPLHVVASALRLHRSVALSAAKGNFQSIEELTDCMRASMLLPGIAGPWVHLPSMEGEPLVDSQLYEPMPFRSALESGCTHVLVLRSRPDDVNVIAATKLPERLIMRRFFKRKYGDVDAYEYMKKAGHKQVYAEDILALNEGARARAGSRGPFLLPLSLSKGSAQVGRLERTREGILEGVRTGYQHAHDILRRCSDDDKLSHMNGWDAACSCFPNEILEHDHDPWAQEWLATNSKPQ
jgi:predicted acylesterase/phospholipase RssA